MPLPITSWAWDFILWVVHQWISHRLWWVVRRFFQLIRSLMHSEMRISFGVCFGILKFETCEGLIGCSVDWLNFPRISWVFPFRLAWREPHDNWFKEFQLDWLFQPFDFVGLQVSSWRWLIFGRFFLFQREWRFFLCRWRWAIWVCTWWFRRGFWRGDWNWGLFRCFTRGRRRGCRFRLRIWWVFERFCVFLVKGLLLRVFWSETRFWGRIRVCWWWIGVLEELFEVDWLGPYRGGLSSWNARWIDWLN